MKSDQELTNEILQTVKEINCGTTLEKALTSTILLEKVSKINYKFCYHIVSELIGYIYDDIDINWCNCLLQKLISRISVESEKQKIYKKICDIIESRESLPKYGLSMILEIIIFLPKTPNTIPTIFYSFLEYSLNDVIEISPKLFKLNTKNLLFIIALIFQNYLETHFEEFYSLNDTKINDYYISCSKLLHSICEETEHKHSLTSEFVKSFKIYLSFDRSVYLKPFLLSVFIISSFDSLIESNKIVSFLFNEYSSEETKEHQMHANVNILIDESFERIIEILKFLDTKPFFTRVQSQFLDLGMAMLKYEDKKTNCEFVNKRGESLVFFIFKVYSELRPGIINKLLQEIVSFNKKIHANLLHLCCLTYQDALKDSIFQVESTLNYLLTFDVDRAKLFISIIMPFIKINHSIKDSFLLLLRQSMLSNNPNQQHVAILGYLMILKNFKNIRGDINMSQCTQFATDSYGLTQQHRQDFVDHVPNLSNEMLCIEVFEYLKRCFCFSDSIKIFIYQGLKEAVSSNEQLIEPILDTLIIQLNHIIQPNKPDVTVNLNESTYISTCKDSLPNLLSTLVYCLNISHHLCKALDREPTKREHLGLQMCIQAVEDILSEHFFNETDHSYIKSDVTKVLIEFYCTLANYNEVKHQNMFDQYLEYKQSSKKMENNCDIEVITKGSLLSLKFIMSEAWKLIIYSGSCVYQDSRYRKFIWKEMNHTALFYVEKMSKSLHDGKYMSRKLSSTIEFCCRIISHNTILYNVTSDENEVDRILEQTIETFLDILNIVFHRYNRIVPLMVKDMDTFLDVNINISHGNAINVAIKLITLINQEIDSTVVFPKSSYTLFVKMLKLLLIQEFDSKYMIEIQNNLLSLFQSKSICLDDKNNVTTLIEIFVKTIVCIEKDYEIILKFATEICNYNKSLQSAVNYHVTFNIFNIRTIKTINVKFMWILCVQIDKIHQKLMFFRNSLKIHKSITSIGKLSDCGKKSTGSFHDILNCDTRDLENISNCFSKVATSFAHFVNVYLPVDVYLEYCKTVLKFYDTLTLLVICQKEYISAKRLEYIIDSSLDVIKQTNAVITPMTHAIVAKFGVRVANQGEGKKVSKRKKNPVSIFGELRIIPSLIYSLENYEKELISASKVTKMNLTLGCRSNTARDFRIDMSKISMAKKDN